MHLMPAAAHHTAGLQQQQTLPLAFRLLWRTTSHQCWRYRCHLMINAVLCAHCRLQARVWAVAIPAEVCALRSRLLLSRWGAVAVHLMPAAVHDNTKWCHTH
jgi:hypothetical protein